MAGQKRLRRSTAAPETPKQQPRKAPRLTKPREKKLRGFIVGEGLPSIPNMQAEIEDMMDVLLGRVPPPIQAGPLTLMEIADAYFARGMELTYLIQKLEREGRVLRGSQHYKFRTGELRTFCEIAKRSSDLGSRRLTADTLHFEQERAGRESYG